MGIAAGVYLGLVAITSAASFVAYGHDKRQAGVGGRRVPERTLHALALLGGWPGALAGQRVFRHKTRKMPFLVTFWGVTALHIAAVSAAGYTLANPGPASRPTPARSAEHRSASEHRPGEQGASAP
jgi:uncharacterized membrane protein YsdA (DUF1294 family)